jgi:hypothetical protein
MISRRAFLVAGVAGSAALGLAWWMHGTRIPSRADPSLPLDAGARAVLAACIPVLLEGCLPASAEERARTVRATVDDVGVAIAGLPPATQRELHQLFALLDWAPTRLALAGLAIPWADAEAGAVSATLERWRTRDTPYLRDLLRSAYDALHQLVLAAWYANPRAWAAIGYAGPPDLT